MLLHSWQLWAEPAGSQIDAAHAEERAVNRQLHQVRYQQPRAERGCADATTLVVGRQRYVLRSAGSGERLRRRQEPFCKEAERPKSKRCGDRCHDGKEMSVG